MGSSIKCHSGAHLVMHSCVDFVLPVSLFLLPLYCVLQSLPKNRLLACKPYLRFYFGGNLVSVETKKSAIEQGYNLKVQSKSTM